MSKKKSLLIPAGLLFFIMYIFTSSYYTSSKVLFVIRNIAIYLIFVYVIVLLQIIIKDFIIKKYSPDIKRQSLVKIMIGVSGATLLLITGVLQVYIINLYEKPVIVACDYYDNYENIIFVSRSNSCPTELDYTQLGSDVSNPNIVKIEFYEDSTNDYYEGNIEYYTYIKLYYQDEYLTDYQKTTLEIHYDNRNNVISKELQKVVQNTLIDSYTITVTQDFYSSDDSSITTSNYKDYLFNDKSSIVKYESNVYWPMTDYFHRIEVTKETYNNVDGTTLTERIIFGKISTKGGDYQIYIDNLPIDLYFEIGTSVIASRKLESHVSKQYSIIYYRYGVIASVTPFSYDGEEDTDKLVIQVKNKEYTYLYGDIKYVQEFFEDRMISREIKYSTGAYVKNSNVMDFLEMRDFEYEVNQERILTDQTDLQIYLQRNNYIFIDYYLELLKEVYGD